MSNDQTLDRMLDRIRIILGTMNTWKIENAEQTASRLIRVLNYAGMVSDAMHRRMQVIDHVAAELKATFCQASASTARQHRLIRAVERAHKAIISGDIKQLHYCATHMANAAEKSLRVHPLWEAVKHELSTAITLAINNQTWEEYINCQAKLIDAYQRRLNDEQEFDKLRTDVVTQGKVMPGLSS
jgi:hypothetical protein